MDIGPPPYALLFPGQGNQYPGMGWRAYQRSRRARMLFREAERLTGIPIRRLCFDGTRPELARTQITQPCLLVASLACVAALEEELEAAGRRLEPQLIAGHSLGHFAALVTARALPFASALELVCARAELMAEVTEGGMATVVGLASERVRTLCRSVAEGAVVVAAVNGPCHTVISGASLPLAEALEAMRAAGAARIVVLPVSVPAHTPLMVDAQVALKPRIARLSISRPRFPIVLNGTAHPTLSPIEIGAELMVHMCRPVQWWPSVQAMLVRGVRLLVDTGPGRALAKSLGPELGAMTATLEQLGTLAASPC